MDNNMNDLRDLLRYDIRHLYSAEEQIIEALPAMIDKASNPQLKQSLEQHFRVTEQQRDRLDRVRQQLDEGDDSDNDGGIFGDLFGTGSSSKGIEGLIDEGEKVMGVDMRPEVMDAAIIGCAQKIEHYEIAAYGTARTFAQQLGLTEVAQLLQQTLDEEHETNDSLTSLAVRDINEMAEAGSSGRMSGSNYR
jgi:ferritin-like metal-binding protein YciE